MADEKQPFAPWLLVFGNPPNDFFVAPQAVEAIGSGDEDDLVIIYTRGRDHCLLADKRKLAELIVGCLEEQAMKIQMGER